MNQNHMSATHCAESIQIQVKMKGRTR